MSKVISIAVRMQLATVARELRNAQGALMQAYVQGLDCEVLEPDLRRGIFRVSNEVDELAQRVTMEVTELYSRIDVEREIAATVERQNELQGVKS